MFEGEQDSLSKKGRLMLNIFHAKKINKKKKRNKFLSWIDVSIAEQTIHQRPHLALCPMDLYGFGPGDGRRTFFVYLEKT